MGQAITKIASVSTREIKMINLERRTEKVISQDKPIPAPKYSATVKELERLKEENVPTDYLHKKDENLDKFLKNVYVTASQPAPPLERKIDPKRPLPQNKKADTEITFGYSEKEELVVPEGRVSLKQALEFISNHQNDAKKYSNKAIASQYKLSLEDTNDILQHFQLFIFKVQKKEVDPSTLSTYEQLQLRVKNMTIVSGPKVLKDIDALLKKKPEEGAKGENSEVGKGQEKNDLQLEKNVSFQRKRDLKTKNDEGEPKENEELKTEEKLDTSQEKMQLKPKEGLEKGYIRKGRQENG